MQNAASLIGRDPATSRAFRVAFSGGVITEVGEVGVPADEPLPWIAPGLVDLQVNGYAGNDINADDASGATVTAMVRALARSGVTTVVPTIVTAPEEKIIAALAAIADARARDAAVAHAIPFVHVEGPFISAEDGPRGVHDKRFIRPADTTELARWLAASNGLVGMVTVSPHTAEAIEFIESASKMGVRCSIGHTHASPDQITAAAVAGATLATHLGNGANALLPRHPNYIWSQLADDRIHAGFIADGHHLSPETFRAMLRAKGLTRAHLVSDATAIAGLDPGVYDTPVGGQVELDAHGKVSQRDTGRLAGAGRSLADGVATAAIMARLSLADALTLATTNPGGIVGGRGSLQPGAAADVITFDWAPGDRAIAIKTVVAAGYPATATG